uniref:RINT1-like protein MAG2L n=1 Tax=Musa acuminata subsp. malaccensis TaxID=214687 RepID=A0A804IA43_MUSAM|nr:PREDICTED: RINT1-like protein MAG2L isoform X2 [Musa acuminata subsp. malaccensis]
MAAPPFEPVPDASSYTVLSRRSRRLLRRFLDEHFATPLDLSKLPSLTAQLDRECRDLEGDLRCLLEDRLPSKASKWLSRSNDARRILHHLGGFAPCSPPASVRRMVEMDIPLLVKEVARIETVRVYAECSLQLEALVGDLEDAALAIVSQALPDNILSNLSSVRSSADMPGKQEKLLLAVKIMTSIEDKLASISCRRPQWTHLLMAVESRVEKALAIMKPQAITHHRAILASLGWPPGLSSSKLEKDKSFETSNPLVLMQGENKAIYSQSFLALCALQQLLVQREQRICAFSRSHKMYRSADGTDLHRYSCLDNSLWTIDELVNPIASRIEHHFHKWSDQPKFIFALVFKITRDFMDGVDHVLQPLVDRARLVGSSARETWVKAMVKMLLDYLEKEVFPVLVIRYEVRDGFLEVNTSWLHLVDLMITFDKRMRALATSGMPQMELFLEFEGISGSSSMFSIFREHSDWLQIWAEIELEDANNKLRPELENETSWLVCTHQKVLSFQEETESFLLSNREDFKAPSIADSVVKIVWHMVERAELLPTKPMKNQFIRSSSVVFLNDFFLFLVQRCQSVALVDANLEDDDMLRLAGSINVARYFEFVLREWNEDIRFLEMGVAESDYKNEDQHSLGSFFKDEIIYLVNLETDFLEEIMSAILLQFDTLCWDYIDNIEQLGMEQLEQQDSVLDEQCPCVSSRFVEALDMLKDCLNILRLTLNSIDFLDLWRSIADGLDHFIFKSITLSGIKLSYVGAKQYKTDMSALFLIFSAFCAKPEAFFPRTHDSLKILTMDKKDVAYLLNIMAGDERRKEEFLKLRGLFHVTVNQAEKILKSRTFKG